MKRFENYSSPPRHTSSWNVTGRVLVSANAFRILLTRAWNLSAFRSLLYFPSSRTIRKHGAKAGVHTEIARYRAASNYASSLRDLSRFEEARSLMRKTVPVARRILGDGHILTLKMRKIYAKALYFDAAATLDDLCEAVTTLEEIEPTTRRVLGGAHPIVAGIEISLRNARAALRARETPSPGDA